ncbi:hypothetical protein ACH5RR_014173 [Cinchona calisaya]|uniref:Uncharacterized protein n=1 Tax=Cinchona calisaya TaxID=153742 RepID=A0ABD3A237_9GENT
MSEYNSTSPNVNSTGLFNHWNSPLPYLFGGLALLLFVIALALILLACSFTKSPSSITQSSDNHGSSTAANVLRPEMEPRIVVIMAGDHNPTYLAKPTATTSSIRHSEEV